MGDDAELYMDMQKSWFWDMVEEYDQPYNDCRKIPYRKKNLIVFIDAESVPASCVPIMDKKISKIGNPYEVRYYALQSNKTGWKEIEKNKVDKKLIKDAKKSPNH